MHKLSHWRLDVADAAHALFERLKKGRLSQCIGPGGALVLR